MEVKSPPPGKEGIVGYRCGYSVRWGSKVEVKSPPPGKEGIVGYRCGYSVRWGSKVEVKSPPPRQGRHSRVQVWVQCKVRV